MTDKVRATPTNSNANVSSVGSKVSVISLLHPSFLFGYSLHIIVQHIMELQHVGLEEEELSALNYLAFVALF